MVVGMLLYLFAVWT